MNSDDAKPNATTAMTATETTTATSTAVAATLIQTFISQPPLRTCGPKRQLLTTRPTSNLLDGMLPNESKNSPFVKNRPCREDGPRQEGSPRKQLNTDALR